MGDEGCVLASSPSKTEKIKVLSKEEIAQIYDMKESYGIDLSQIDVDKFNISNFGLKNKKNKKKYVFKKELSQNFQTLIIRIDFYLIKNRNY